MDHVINTNFEIVRKDIEDKQWAYDEKQRKFKAQMKRNKKELKQ